MFRTFFTQIIKTIGLLVILSTNQPTFAKAIPISLRDQIAQMLIFGFDGSALTRKNTVSDWIEKDHIGGLIAFDSDKTGQLGKNIQSKSQIQKLTQELQVLNSKSNAKAHLPQTPLLIAIDYEGGWVDRLKSADGFEPTLSAHLFTKVSPGKRQHELAKMTNYLKVSGFNLDLAPIVDVEVNPDNPIIGIHKRSYSQDPNQVTHFASQFIHALRKAKLQCALKHFPGHGSATEDSHLNAVDVTKTWKSYELFPYQKLISMKPSCGVVMSAHIINRQLDPSGLPATLSHQMLTKLLRDHLHFQGVVMSDDMQMNAIAKHFPLKKALTLAINAGVDLLLFANQDKDIHNTPKEVIDLIEQLVKAKVIPEARIHEAYARIQKLKETLN